MKKLIFFNLLVYITFSSTFSQNKNIDGISEEYYLKLSKILTEQSSKTKILYASRGASSKYLRDKELYENSGHFIRYFASDHLNLGLLIYSYENDSLKLNLISKAKKIPEIKIAITKSNLSNFIKDVNYLYSSSFFNRAPQKRGTITQSINKSKDKLVKSFKKLNKILFPSAFKLETFDHIIFLPALNIGTLPFSCFEIKGKYLIDRMSYSIAPNIYEFSISAQMNRNKHDMDMDTELTYFWENALFVSNPKYPENLDWSFPNLPGAEDEVNYIINKSAPTKYKHLSGIKATEENILKNICSYDLLYFATHGINDAKNPMDKSFLVLADDKSETPFITSREIMNIRNECQLKADLVVLSACQTGLGKAHEGGTIGLARAFQMAGANHVLMSLWNIDDNETATLMKFFFDELSKGGEMMPHSALRKAILKYKREVNKDPKYWAAFSLFGVPY